MTKKRADNTSNNIGMTLYDLIQGNRIAIAILALIILIAYTTFVHIFAKPETEVKLFFGLVCYTKAINKEKKTDKNIKGKSEKDGSEKNKDNELVLLLNKIESLNENELKRYLGQLFLVGFKGKGNEIGDSNIIDVLVNNYKIGGLLFYDRNIIPIRGQFSKDDATRNLIRFINTIKSKNRSTSKLPLFIGVDFEGGNVSPLVKAGVATSVPSPMALAAIREKNAVYKASVLISTELKELGFNLNLAPIVDVSTSDTNNIIQERSFGENPNLVYTLATEFIKGQDANGIIPVIKHFPGHGMTEAGFETPDLPISYQPFDAFKSALGPFHNLIKKQNVPVIMTSHMQLNCCGTAGNIAFNSNIIDNLLQTDEKMTFVDHALQGLEYSGIVMADNLLAPCITSKSGEQELNIENYMRNVKNNVIKSFDAGHHMLMLSHIFPDKDINFLYKEREYSKDIFRWGITISEFIELYDFLGKKIFKEKDTQKRIARINKFREALKKIINIKIKLLSNIPQVGSIEKYYTAQQQNNHLNLSEKLFNSSFVILKSQVRYKGLSKYDFNDKITVFMPSRFMSYGGINKAKMKDNYEDRLLKNVLDFNFTKSLYSNFRNKTNIHFELEKFDPADLLEQSMRAKGIIKILEDHKSDHVIFIINKRVRWYLLQHVLKEIEKSNKYKFENVTAIITNDATLLRSCSNDLNHDTINKLLSKINIIVAFSGYGFRAELLARQLSSGKISKSKAKIPFKIDRLNPMPNYEIKETSF